MKENASVIHGADAGWHCESLDSQQKEGIGRIVYKESAGRIDSEMKLTVRLLVILIATLGSLAAEAQNNSALLQNRTHIFYFSPVVGRNISHLTIDSTENTYGSLAGVAFTYRHKKKHLSASASAIYSSRGASWKRVIAGQYGETYHWSHYEQLHYVEMPVKFTYLFFADSSKTFRPKISIGPSFGVLVGAKHLSEYEIPEWYTSSDAVTENVMKNYKPFDIGALASAGFNWEFRHRRTLSLEAGYKYGLMDINNNPSIKQSISNRDIFILAGLEFPLIKQRFR